MEGLNPSTPTKDVVAVAKPVKVEFIGLLPTVFDHCSHCMDVMEMCELEPYYEQMREYPKEVVETYYNAASLALSLKREFGERVFVDVIDTVSPQGLWKTIRHRILRTPCVVINGKKAFNGIPALEDVRSRVAALLAQASFTQS